MMAGREGGIAQGGVMPVGGVLQSCSSSLCQLFARCRGTAVLWTLCPVVAHLAGRGAPVFILHTSILNLWPGVCFLTFLTTQRAKMCVHLSSPTHFFFRLFPLLLPPRQQCFYKSTSYSFGVVKWVLYVSQVNSARQIHWQNGRKQVLSNVFHICEVEFLAQEIQRYK